MTGPLDGIVVADFTRVLSGPWCTMTLGDLGADVIKIERPGTGDETRGWGPPFAGGESAYYLSTNRNKRSIALDLGRAEHHEVARRLVARADVVVENFRPGTMDRLGFGVDACRQINPAVIYASISGFGQTGPMRDRPGYDFMIQALGGIMHLTGEPDGEPQKVGVAIADITAGLYCAIGILSALHSRDVTGHGHVVDVSLMGSQVAWLANQAANHLIGKTEPVRMGNAHPNIVPYQVFPASDHPFVVAVANEQIWRRFCDAIERPALADDPGYATNADRVGARDALVADLTALFASGTRDRWLRVLSSAQVPCGPINTISEVFADPQVQALGLVEQIPHPTAGEVASVRSPIGIDGALPSARRHPPLLGEQTADVLSWLGYGPDEMSEMMVDPT